ncbi:secreted RxLR effector protein 78-like [Lycium ferocissimum]|uniref:secreted RxLR effector protein 78-like n=1 Tax=Lycium ferocissimum TaxID=112874 RepID=UPI00281678FC|nr:secreted RxLR effector protein 78-like [Lycium ferocissimum]
MDATLIASECVDSRLRGEHPGIMCKLDIEKAYDHVNWDFLLNILKQMGFGERWLKWIGFCIKTVRFSILVNGEPAGFFPSVRGLRQGDPLSPFHFILAMEGFNSTMRVAIQNSWLKGFRIGNQACEEMQICHLLYADDTVIFCEAKAEQLRFIRLILVVFEGVSGLALNWRKSSIFPIKEVRQIRSLANILGCKI